MKKKNWTITKLIAVGSLGVLQFVLTLPIRGLFIGSGNNPLGAIFYLVSGPIFTVITLLLVKQFGSVTIKNLVVTLTSLPFPHVYPFPFYIFLGPAQGIILDSLFYFLKQRRRLSFLLIGGVDSFIEAFSLYAIYITIGYAHAEKLPGILLESIKMTGRLILLFGLIFLIGAASGYGAYLIYQKIKNTSVVRRIQQ